MASWWNGVDTGGLKPPAQRRTGSSPVDARLLNSNKEEQKHNIIKEIQDEGTVILSDKERPRD